MQWFDKRGIKYILIVGALSSTIYFLIPIFVGRSTLLTHIVVNYYIHQLRRTVLLLPVGVFLYNILWFRKFIDYQNCLRKIKEPHFLLAVFVSSFLATNLISYYLYDHIPQGDAIVPFYQAKIFAQGNRWTNPPLYPEFFISEMISHKGKWFGMMPPGHSIILMIGILLKIPWIICPLLGSLSLLIFYFLLKHLFNSKLAMTGTLFLLLSPTFLFISASMLTQNSSYFFLLASLLLITKSKKAIYHFFSGLSTGFAFLSRPQVSLVFLIALIIFLICKKEAKKTVCFALGFIPFFVVQLIDNYILTGNPLHYGYWLHEIPKYHALGFGPEKGAPTFNIPGHTPLKAVINLIYNGFVLSLHLFGWSLLSLIFIPVVFLKKARTSSDTLAAGIIIGTVIFWMSYWFHGVSPMGPKYYYEIVPLLVLLTVRGIEELKINLRPLITVLFLIDVFVYIPQASKIFSVWGTNLNCYNEVKKKGVHNAIVFVRDLPGESEEIFSINRFNYASVAFRNSPNLKEGDIIYVRDLGPEKNKLLKEQYHDRKAYLFEYLNFRTWHLIEY